MGLNSILYTEYGVHKQISKRQSNDRTDRRKYDDHGGEIPVFAKTYRHHCATRCAGHGKQKEYGIFDRARYGQIRHEEHGNKWHGNQLNPRSNIRPFIRKQLFNIDICKPNTDHDHRERRCHIRQEIQAIHQLTDNFIANTPHRRNLDKRFFDCE